MLNIPAHDAFESFGKGDAGVPAELADDLRDCQKISAAF